MLELGTIFSTLNSVFGRELTSIVVNGVVKAVRDSDAHVSAKIAETNEKYENWKRKAS